MTLEKGLRELQPEVKKKLDEMIHLKYYERVKNYIGALERYGYDVEYYKGVLKDEFKS